MKTFLMITAMTIAAFQPGRAETTAKEDVARLRTEIKQSMDELSTETILTSDSTRRKVKRICSGSSNWHRPKN